MGRYLPVRTVAISLDSILALLPVITRFFPRRQDLQRTRTIGKMNHQPLILYNYENKTQVTDFRTSFMLMQNISAGARGPIGINSEPVTTPIAIY